MGKYLNVRLTDELEKSLKKVSSEIQVPQYAEVNTSTVVRGALEEFIDRREKEKQGWYHSSICLDLDKKEIREMQKIIKNITTNLEDDSKVSSILWVHLNNIYGQLIRIDNDVK